MTPNENRFKLIAMCFLQLQSQAFPKDVHDHIAGERRLMMLYQQRNSLTAICATVAQALGNGEQRRETRCRRNNCFPSLKDNSVV